MDFADGLGRNGISGQSFRFRYRPTQVIESSELHPAQQSRARAVFLDAELGDLLGLTKSEKGYDLRPLTTAKGSAPAGIFDAIADHDGYLLAATASELVRFNPESGERQVIPSPNATEEFKTIVRDSAGRIWTAGSCCTCRSMKGNIGLSFGCQC